MDLQAKSAFALKVSNITSSCSLPVKEGYVSRQGRHKLTHTLFLSLESSGDNYFTLLLRFVYECVLVDLWVLSKHKHFIYHFVTSYMDHILKNWSQINHQWKVSWYEIQQAALLLFLNLQARGRNKKRRKQNQTKKERKKEKKNQPTKRTNNKPTK